MRKIVLIFGLLLSVLLAACGGGGGSPGTTNATYTISVRADRTNLPLNIADIPPYVINPDCTVGITGNTVYAPHTTALYVTAKKGNNVIVPSGDSPVIGCSILGGVKSGSMYYLDGNEDHWASAGKCTRIKADGTPEDVDLKVPAAYYSLSLPSYGGGGGLFYFNSGDQAGTARITCSIQDPQTSTYVASDSVDIVVGAATGKPSSMEVMALALGPLGVQGNTSNLRTSMGIQSYLWDDANQPVPDPSARNLQVSIKAVPGTAWLGARLQSGAASGANVQVSTINGVSLVTLSSGPVAGPILLEFTADRYDNNVANGIQDPVTQFFAVYVVEDANASQLAFASATYAATNGQSFSVPLKASGGTLPYTWTALDSLPNNLSLAPDSGIISGVVNDVPGSHAFRVRVTDAKGAAATAVVTINVTGATPTTPALVINPAAISGTVGTSLSYAMTATGGKPPLTWAAAGALPAGLTMSSVGVISGTPTVAGDYSVAVSVTDSSSPALSATGNITIKIAP